MLPFSHSVLLRKLLSKSMWVFLLYTSFGLQAYGQNGRYDWWEAKHNWDGVTPWQNYLTISPAFMGPNALPVPELDMAYISHEFSFTARGDFYFGKGDQTQNVFTRIYLPLAKAFAAAEVFYVPFEWYKLNAATRDLRKAREFEAEGLANGDVYFGTTIKVLHEVQGLKRPAITFGMFAKTASGTHLFNARFTDTPGYYFTVNLGKTLRPFVNQDHSIRLYASQGFYVWQTYSDKFLQNDAYSFGAGVKVALGQRWEFKQEFAGYIGYIDDGDKPMLLRTMLSHRGQMIRHALRFQLGLNDFPYNSISYGVSLFFQPKYIVD